MTPERVGQNQPVAVRHTFAGLPVADYASAYDWYVRLLGREADVFPHQSECVWRLTETSSIYVVQNPERAGRALVTLALDDLDAHEKRLRDGEFTFTEEASGAAPRRLVVSDIDGNRHAFFEDPAPTGA
jgi:catechol 2,3-dioxygenase-like lactoylglutathione lyase family enzyme